MTDTPAGRSIILHICPRTDWTASRNGFYRCDSLDDEGFIHCSTPEQVIEAADFLFQGQQGLVLLVIDPARVTVPIRYEDAGNGKFYPHIYGPLAASAVVEVLPFEPATDDGRFAMPPQLKP